MGATPYFAPTYFSSFYFPPLVSTQVAPQPTFPYADRDAYQAILQQLRATQLFEAVLFAGPVDRLPSGLSGSPVATIVPEGWEEFDEVDPGAVLRRVTFLLDLLVRDDDPLARFDRLAQVESSARAAIDGSDLGGGCLPALTRLRRAQYDRRSLHPEQTVRIDGEFTYLVSPLIPNGTTL